MTQKSFPWTCTPIGDGGSYSVEMVEMQNMFLGNFSPSRAGVLYWTDTDLLPGHILPTDELLEPLLTAPNIVGFRRGIGMVKGWFYINSNPNITYPSYNVNGGNANAIDIIGLRLDVAGQVVRSFHGRGAAGNKYNLVQTNAIWEIPIAEVLLDGSGNYSSFIDVREFVVSSASGRVLIYNGVENANVDATGLSLTAFSKLEVIYTAQQSGGVGASTVDLNFNGDTGNNYYKAGSPVDTKIRFSNAGSNRFYTVRFEIFIQNTIFTIVNMQGTGSISTGMDTPISEIWQWHRAGAVLDRVQLTLGGAVSQTDVRMRVYGII